MISLRIAYVIHRAACSKKVARIHGKRFFFVPKEARCFSPPWTRATILSTIVPPLLSTCSLPFLYVSCSSCLSLFLSHPDSRSFLFLSVSPPLSLSLFLLLPPDRSENDGRLAPRVKGKASGRLHGGGRSTRHTIRNDSLLRT